MKNISSFIDNLKEKITGIRNSETLTGVIFRIIWDTIGLLFENSLMRSIVLFGITIFFVHLIKAKLPIVGYYLIIVLIVLATGGFMVYSIYQAVIEPEFIETEEDDDQADTSGDERDYNDEEDFSEIDDIDDLL